MPDKIKIEILQDGTISVTTDEISGPNHMSADEFLTQVEKLAGGTTTTKNREGYKAQTHTHGNLIHSH
jgi:hypothetical protein